VAQKHNRSIHRFAHHKKANGTLLRVCTKPDSSIFSLHKKRFSNKLFVYLNKQKYTHMDEYNQDITSTPTIEAVVKPKRPAFITVLCILTFIGSAIGIIGAISSFATAEWTAKTLALTTERMHDLDQYSHKSNVMGDLYGDSFSHMTVGHIQTQAGLSLLASLLTLGGGLLMFGLRRAGFFVYLGGHVVGIGTAVAMGPTGAMGGLGIAVTILVSLVFIVLYSINYRHLVR
jgi:hypothetical protein